MKKLIGHIEELLQYHSCVIVPGFGGFVANEEPARVKGNVIVPPSRRLLFNPLLTYNDGLLAQTYMQSEGLSFVQSMASISFAVKQMERKLRLNRMLVMGSLGRLEKTSVGFRFENNEEAFACADDYGMPKLLFSPVSSAREVRGFTSQVGVRTWVSVAAVILLMLLPLNLKNHRAESAEASLALPAPQSMVVEPTICPEEVAEIALDTTLIVNTKEAESEIVESVENAPLAEVETIEVAKNFHVIIASLPTSKKAMQYINETPDFQDLSVVRADGRYRVSVADFATAEEAEQFLQDFKIDYPAYSSAWVFGEEL